MCSKHSSPKAYCFMAQASIAMMLLYVEVFMLLTLDTEKIYGRRTCSMLLLLVLWGVYWELLEGIPC